MNKRKSGIIWGVGEDAEIVSNSLYNYAKIEISFFEFALPGSVIAIAGLFCCFVSLIILIFLLIIRFKSVNKLSYYLMIPYLLWCFYALFLNINLVILN